MKSAIDVMRKNVKIHGIPNQNTSSLDIFASCHVICPHGFIEGLYKATHILQPKFNGVFPFIVTSLCTRLESDPAWPECKQGFTCID